LSIPYRFKTNSKACELTAFLSALFTYGQRPKIIALLNNLMQAMDNDPGGFIENFNPVHDAKLFDSFVYRFNTGEDIVFLLACLQRAYKEYGSLEALFAAHKEDDLKGSIGGFLDTLTGTRKPHARYGLKFLFAHPQHGGPCKRFNLFLKWVVRDHPDLGLWQQTLKPSELMIPLDTHVLKTNRILGLSKRKSPDWQTAFEITQTLSRYNPKDPIAYDYALMGLGLALNRHHAGKGARKRPTLAQLLNEPADAHSGNCLLTTSAVGLSV